MDEANWSAVRQYDIQPLHSRQFSCLACADIGYIRRMRSEDWKEVSIIIIEHRCSKNSLMGRSIPQSEGCKVIRVIQEHDMTTKNGLNVTHSVGMNSVGR